MRGGLLNGASFVRVRDDETIEGTHPNGEPYTGPLSMTDVRPWADDAACRDLPFLFDAADGRKATSPTLLRAKAICAECPARVLCLAEAMADETGSHQHRFSVRGGLDPHEREALWKQG